MKKLFFSLTGLLAAFVVVSQTGNVGINTTTPAAMLHVKDSSVVFTGGTTLPGTPGNPPISGGGVRMMWYPDKAAFKAGRVINVSWDKDSIGNYSFGGGWNTMAKGIYSTAFGNNTSASGSSSTAMGFGTSATGSNSSAMGLNSIATGINSTAMGSETIAAGTNSVAMGFSTSAIGYRSTALGLYTEATGDNSTAMGRSTIASGESSTSIGYSTSATGTASVAMGYLTSANSYYSTAMGVLTKAENYASTAIGNQTFATGFSSVSMGTRTYATGDHSTTMGDSVTARAYASLTIGRFNDSIITSSPTTWVSSDPLFIIGNGTGDFTRSNAFVVYKNGNTILQGELTRPESGPNKNLLPICYGSVSSAAAINSGTNNFSVSSSATGVYEIAITSETYTNVGFTTNVTASNVVNFRAAVTNANGGNLVVRIFDIAGNLVDAAFHFVVYKQ